jgi:ribosomal protein S18 acetylase RimI-like enzyme
MAKSWDTSWPSCKFFLVTQNVSDEESEDATQIKGHITSISVLRTYRKLGLATKLMEATHRAMKNVYQAANVSLHVRCSNRAALGLYKHRLQYKSSEIEAKYYADGEDAYYMVKELVEGYNLGIDEADFKEIEINFKNGKELTSFEKVLAGA